MSNEEKLTPETLTEEQINEIMLMRSIISGIKMNLMEQGMDEIEALGIAFKKVDGIIADMKAQEQQAKLQQNNNQSC